jgi:hypothetical protein
MVLVWQGQMVEEVCRDHLRRWVEAAKGAREWLGAQASRLNVEYSRVEILDRFTALPVPRVGVGVGVCKRLNRDRLQSFR